MIDDHRRARPYFRTPAMAPAGDRIAFVYAGDIWLVASGGGRAERVTAHPANHVWPRWSPDGTSIAYTSGRAGPGDVYVLPLDGGEVRRLTFRESPSTVECWSPDGATVYFSAQYERQASAIYRVPVAGGTPVRWISQPYERLGTAAISPCGRWVAFSILRDPWWRRGPNPYGGSELWLVSNEPGADDFRLLSDAPGMNHCPMWTPDSRAIYFASDRDGCENLWMLARDGGAAQRVTAFDDGRLLWPSISANGKLIAFERDFGIWTCDPVSGDAEPIGISVRQDLKQTPLRVQTYTRDLTELVLAPDGKKITFVVRGKIFADFADKEADREQRQGPAFRISQTPFRDNEANWAPDSRAIAFVSDRHGDEEVYRYDFVSRGETRLTQSQGRKSAPCYSPDGRWIAYARGDDEIRLIDAASGADRPFAHARFVFGASFSWSPDSRWLAFCAQDERFFSNLYVQHIDENHPRQISFLSNLQAAGPLWAPNGRFIIFTTGQYRAESQIARIDLRPQPPAFREAEFDRLFDPRPDETRGGRAETRPNAAASPVLRGFDADRDPLPPPATEPDDRADAAPAAVEEPTPPAQPSAPANQVTIVFDGIERRLRLLTPLQMDAVAQAISPDSRDLICSATVAGRQNLWTLPLDEARGDLGPRQLTSSNGYKSHVSFAPDGKSFYFLDGGVVAQRKFPKGDQTTLPVTAEVTIDFTQEKRQIFEECWRLLRDYFYDPTFRGLDWNAVRERYTPLVNGAQSVAELHPLLLLMTGELRASHLGVVYGSNSGAQDGYLGLTFDPIEQCRSGALRIAEVIPDSPAAFAGDGAIRPGDLLVDVNGVPLTPAVSLDMLLQRTAGRRVTLRFVSGNNQEREVELRPVTADQYEWLRYRAWVLANEAMVHRVSNGRLGYVHIRRMNYEAYQQFLADLDVETHSKEGVVIDVRFNSGGHTATFILDVLARRSVLLSAFRDRSTADSSHIFGNRVLNKPTVLVTNESSVSNTETFSEAYRRQGLGKVVGRPTAGAVIGTFNRRLIDGSTIRLPQLRVTTPEGEELEGRGRPVDIDVRLGMGEWMRGRDAQLETAARALLAEIDASLHAEQSGA